MNRIINQDLLIDFLYVTLGILIVIIFYRLLIKYLSRKVIMPKDYCTLYDVEFPKSSGEIAFYFTTSTTREVHLFLQDLSGKTYDVVMQTFDEGGHICRFNSTTIPNGSYFYVLKTINQEIKKRIEINN